jgi:hypothetical protein
MPGPPLHAVWATRDKRWCGGKMQHDWQCKQSTQTIYGTAGIGAVQGTAKMLEIAENTTFKIR